MPSKRTHPAWAEFRIDQDGIYPTVTCLHCSTQLFKCQPSRNLLKHLSTCADLSDGEQTKWSRFGEPVKKRKRKRQRRKKTGRTHSPEATQDSVVTDASQLLSQSQTLTDFAGDISSTVKDRFQSDIARGFYAAGLSFRSIEVPRMRKALTILQPGMEPYLPSRKALAGRLLTKEYEREKAELISRLRDEPTLALISDGWSSVSKEKVVNYVVVSPLMRPLLWCTKTTGEDEQTAGYVAEAIGAVIDEINAVVGALVVVSVTTDSAPVMQKAWEILERERRVCCNGCSSHALNLVLEDVLKHPWLSTTLTKSVILAKFIRNRHQLLARFRHVQKEGKEEHRRTLRLPVPTRWYSSVECIKSVSDNRRTISKVFRQKKFMKRFGRRPAKLNEARRIVNDKEFWGRLKVMMNLLQPIVDAIAMLEQDTCSISVVYWQFSELQRSPVYNLRLQNAPRAVQTSILKAIEARWAFLHTDTMGVSFLLDHTKTSSDFVDADLAGSVASVKALAQRLGFVKTEAEKQQLSAEVDDFQLKKSRWSSETRFKEEGLSPMAWWADKLLRKASDDNYYPLLAPLASLIYTIPTSSAASERSWSIHEFIHSKRRNRLDAKRVEKLVFIYCNAGSKDAKRNIFYRAEGESESESDGDDDAEAASDASMDEDDSSEESVCVNSESVDDFDDSNAFSYDGSEEHKEG